MPNKRLIAWLIIALVSITSLAFAQQDIREYKVQQGDTLWDISKKELNDPFLWPKVWKENPEIANPDLLMPGQIVRIPLYLIQKEAQKEEPVSVEPAGEKEAAKEVPLQTAAPAPVRERPLVDENLYIASGQITSSVDERGKISGSPSEKRLLGTLDMVYIQTKDQVKIGDRFYIIRKGELVRHPATKAPVGYFSEIAGVAEIRKFEYGETVAQILKTYSEVRIGDILDTYSVMNPPVGSKPYRKPDVRGYIVGAKQMRLNNGLFDIVYIDRGKNSGLETGDILTTIAVGKHKVPNGTVQIIKVHEATSAAVVRESSGAVTRGNIVTKAE